MTSLGARLYRERVATTQKEMHRIGFEICTNINRGRVYSKYANISSQKSPHVVPYCSLLYFFFFFLFISVFFFPSSLTFRKIRLS